MGFNTAVMILNDHIHEIAKDRHFGEKLAEAISRAGRERLYTSGFEVLPTQHADTMQIVAIGGNTMRRLGYSSCYADDEQILRDLANDLGFRVSRKRSKK